MGSLTPRCPTVHLIQDILRVSVGPERWWWYPQGTPAQRRRSTHSAFGAQLCISEPKARLTYSILLLGTAISRRCIFTSCSRRIWRVPIAASSWLCWRCRMVTLGPGDVPRSLPPRSWSLSLLPRLPMPSGARGGPGRGQKGTVTFCAGTSRRAY